MSEARAISVLKRKAAPRPASGPVDAAGQPLPRAAKALVDAVKRVGEEALNIGIEASSPVETRATPNEIMERLPESPFLAVLEGPDGGVGVFVLDLPALSCLIETITTGKVSSQSPLQRRPTRVDAGLMEDLIDRLLAEFESPLLDCDEARWASGWRYQFFLSEPRPLAIVLEEATHRIVETELRFAGGARTGRMQIVVPAVGRAEPRPAPLPPEGTHDARRNGDWTLGLTRNVDASHAVVEAVLGKVRLPLSALSALAPGDRIAFSMDALSAVRIAGPGGVPVALARLGRAEGRRAVKIIEAEDADLPHPLEEGVVIEAGTLASRPTAPASAALTPSLGLTARESRVTPQGTNTAPAVPMSADTDGIDAGDLPDLGAGFPMAAMTMDDLPGLPEV